jgi:hypothetical protein
MSNIAVLVKQLPYLSTKTLTHDFYFNIDISLDTFNSFFNNYFCPSNSVYTKITNITNGFGIFDPVYNPSDVFILRDCIIQCAKADEILEFTPISLIELTKEINKLNYFSDLNIINSIKLADINPSIGNTYVITTVFTNQNTNILPVVCYFCYNII